MLALQAGKKSPLCRHVTGQNKNKGIPSPDDKGGQQGWQGPALSAKLPLKLECFTSLFE